MNVVLKTKNAVTLAKIKGDLDHHTAKDIRAAIDKEIKGMNSNFLILDFSAVTFMDSSGIGLVMGRYKLMEEWGGEVVVACPPNYIKKVLNLAGIDRLTRIVEDYSDLFKDKEDEKEREKIEEKTN